MLCGQRVLDYLGTLILEYSRAGNVVPMVVTVDHEFHRLVGDLPDLVHHVLGSHRIDRVSDDWSDRTAVQASVQPPPRPSMRTPSQRLRRRSCRVPAFSYLPPCAYSLGRPFFAGVQ